MQPDYMTGAIVLWSGAIVDIPSGWVICDGNNGTPDLRDSFVVGAGNSYAVGASGGGTSHVHNFTGNGHVHPIPGGMGIAGGANFANVSGSTQVTGTTDAGSSLPPYYALAYIMKL